MKKKENLMTRRTFCAGLFSGTAMLGIGSLIRKTSLIPGLSAAADANAEEQQWVYEYKNTYEGVFRDRFWTPLVETPEKTGVAAMLKDPLPYSHLVGYNQASDSQSNLRKKFREYLYHRWDETGYGCSVKLTIDDELQRQAYDLVCRGKYGASAVILDCDTGELLVQTSSQFSSELEYDVNRIEELSEEYKKYSGFYMDPAVSNNTMPGSTSKLITAAALLRNHADLNYTDTTGEYKGIHNYKGSVLGELDLVRALKQSSNVYFAHGADQIGREALLEELERFGYNGRYFMDDGWDMTPSAVLDDEASARQAAIGQGKVNGCCMFNAMIYGSLCSGDMVLPHSVKGVFSEQEKMHGIPRPADVIAHPLKEEEIRYTLREALSACAERYGLRQEGCKIMAKSGTATVAGHGNSIHLCAVVETPDGQHFSIALNQRESKNTSSALIDPMQKLIALLAERSPLYQAQKEDE